MDSIDITKLRATAQTLEAVEESRTRIADAETHLRAELKGLNAGRQDLVISGTRDQIDAARARIVAIDRQLAELADLGPVLDRQVDAIKRAAIIANDRELVEVANAKVEKWLSWHRENYQRLAKELAAGMLLEDQAILATGRAEHLRRMQKKSLDGVDLPPIDRVRVASGAYTFSSGVRLPGVTGNRSMAAEENPAFWWARDAEVLGPDPHVFGVMAATRQSREEPSQERREPAQARPGSAPTYRGGASATGWDRAFGRSGTQPVASQPAAAAQTPSGSAFRHLEGVTLSQPLFSKKEK